MKKNNKNIVIILILAVAVVIAVTSFVLLQPQGPKISLPQTDKAISMESTGPDGGGASPDQI